MTNPVREVQVTLTLDPQLASDNLALATLQRWYQRAEILNKETDNFDFFRLSLHKDIYLSGLMLCLLEPSLVKFLARNLQLHNLNNAFLQQSLEEHRLIEGPGAPATEPSGQFTPDELATHIADKLSPLLSALDESTSQHEQHEELQTQVKKLVQQLQKQSKLLQQQALLLEKLTQAGGQVQSDPTQNHPLPAQVAGEVQRHDLSETAAKVRKVRAKGIF
ncbi:hypothetical protein CJP72_14750 [Citrobacter sp. NCU1]|uniref:hypothetical protein n=1 Tax=Citrobacter sp. NCU1 TaxID=2026683 RepID=UPI001391B19B|nr:hypothetical protein [Citrobacter sp. NCU1]NDO81976.1 hypothetical protein [Citrobacter sp. NCU1]